MDSNADGMVDFDEFVAATLHVHQLEQTNSTKWHHRSKAAFSKFDVDGDGYITAQELKIVSTQPLLFVVLESQYVHACSLFLMMVHLLQNMQATGLKGSVETLLDEADTDGDGRISLPEFQKLLHQASFGSRTNTEHHQQRK